MRCVPAMIQNTLRTRTVWSLSSVDTLWMAKDPITVSDWKRRFFFAGHSYWKVIETRHGKKDLRGIWCEQRRPRSACAVPLKEGSLRDLIRTTKAKISLCGATEIGFEGSDANNGGQDHLVWGRWESVILGIWCEQRRPRSACAVPLKEGSSRDQMRTGKAKISLCGAIERRFFEWIWCDQRRPRTACSKQIKEGPSRDLMRLTRTRISLCGAIERGFCEGSDANNEGQDQLVRCHWKTVLRGNWCEQRSPRSACAVPLKEGSSRDLMRTTKSKIGLCSAIERGFFEGTDANNEVQDRLVQCHWKRVLRGIWCEQRSPRSACAVSLKDGSSRDLIRITNTKIGLCGAIDRRFFEGSDANNEHQDRLVQCHLKRVLRGIWCEQRSPRSACVVPLKEGSSRDLMPITKAKIGLCSAIERGFFEGSDANNEGQDQLVRRHWKTVLRVHKI